MKNTDLAILIDHLDLEALNAKCHSRSLKPGDAFALKILQEHYNFHVDVA